MAKNLTERSALRGAREKNNQAQRKTLKILLRLALWS
jgi:hypothetical protein